MTSSLCGCKIINQWLVFLIAVNKKQLHKTYLFNSKKEKENKQKERKKEKMKTCFWFLYLTGLCNKSTTSSKLIICFLLFLSSK